MNSGKARTFLIICLIATAHSLGQAFLVKGQVNGWVYPPRGVGAGSLSHTRLPPQGGSFCLGITKAKKSGTVIGSELISNYLLLLVIPGITAPCFPFPFLLVSDQPDQGPLQHLRHFTSAEAEGRDLSTGLSTGSVSKPQQAYKGLKNVSLPSVHFVSLRISSKNAVPALRTSVII